MSYVTVKMSKDALRGMKEFHSKLSSLYSDYSINIEDDTGRRNMLMSSLQEKMFAAELKSTYPLAFANGKTGEPDIIIPELSKELECKLTSKNKSGSWSLQTDYNTLKGKEKLDYLYVLSSRDFQQFAVLYFEGLTCDDFHPPAPGSKGKSRMRVSHALKKCTPLVGQIENKAEGYVSAARKTLSDSNSSPSQISKAKKKIKHWSENSRISFHLEGIDYV